MTVTFFNILEWLIVMLFYLVVPKLLTQDWKFRLKEGMYLLLSAIALVVFSILLLYFSIDLHLWTPIALILILLIYYCKLKSYPFRKAVTFTFLATMLINLSNMLVFQFLVFAGEAVVSSLGTDAHTFWSAALPFLLLDGVLVISLTLLFVKVSRKLRNRINQNKRVQTVLAWISGSVRLLFKLADIIMHYQAEVIVFIVSWQLFFLLGFTATIFVSFLFYVRSERTKVALREKIAEQVALQAYTSQTEQQLTSIRKFKHDYQNILLPLVGFVQEKDWIGLEQYMPKVKAVSTIITKDNFMLENLSKIKVPEIKILLAAKLMLAQNISIDIHTTFEAHEEIEHIPVDSVVLVRMLGIILDNAIEELTALGAGRLMVACYKVGNGITFVVQNTCRPDIQPLRELKQVGYSTKGENRGLGLSNLAELVAAHSDSLSLQTSITDGNFIQKLRIGGA